MFDPYHRWLAIPKGKRPPNYYQLLGVDSDEADAEVIAEAALRQASHVRTYQTGPHAERCTALLNEIAQARATLLHPDRRREYDARIGRPRADDLADSSGSAAARTAAGLADPVALAYVALLLLGGLLAFWLGYGPRPVTPAVTAHEPADRPGPGRGPTGGEGRGTGG
jgi:hypothetical protein